MYELKRKKGSDFWPFFVLTVKEDYSSDLLHSVIRFSCLLFIFYNYILYSSYFKLTWNFKL